jgi:tetratricopeptide (TPR) repeat protein
MPEAKRLLELALETDPNNPAVFWNVSGLYWQMEEYGLSLRAAREAADMAPNAPIFLSRYAQAAAWAGKLELAAELAERSEELYRPPQSPSTQDAVLYLSLIGCYARIGLVQKAQHAFDDLIQLEGGVVTVDVLWQANLFLGRFDVAMDLLNDALEERFPGAVNSVAFTSRHPVFDPVREHPGFQRALAKVRRPEST